MPGNLEDLARLLRRLENSIEASNRVHREMLEALRLLVERERESADEQKRPAPLHVPGHTGPVYHDTKSAAEHLQLSPRTLEQWRFRGAGPPFVKFGSQVRYDSKALDDWVESRRRNSTSDPGEDATKRGRERRG